MGETQAVEVVNKGGRPSGSYGPRRKYQDAISGMESQFAASLPQVASALVGAALGRYKLMKHDARNNRWQPVTTDAEYEDWMGEQSAGIYRLYLTDPDPRAAMDIIERIAGKVPQEVSVELKEQLEGIEYAHRETAKILMEYIAVENLPEIRERLLLVSGTD